jgi:hypothetical protein
VIACVSRLEHLEVCPQWQGFVARLQQRPVMAALLAEQEGQGLREKGM